ncbi:auxilin-like protein 1 isoform X2 [Canna indica]|uniref:Auxilin-like protein 1 isoform X2 n=1 Tax=Canna indica TaxID=4628 RepID=A0AAQ3KRY0_9LILI|nr:auxilin-like protein 1 isoform X2 [Canna indica]
MEESRRLGGGAAVSQKPTGRQARQPSAYSDIFGGSRKFAARLDDYAEIFGDLAGSCSIPFLDLPPALQGRDVRAGRGAGFDYSEIFGGLDFGEFVAPYELFAATRREEAHSENGRTVGEATSSQQATDSSEFCTRHSNGDHVSCKEADWSSSNSNCSDNRSTQSNVHNKSTEQSKVSTTNVKAQTTRLDDVPAFSFVIDTLSSVQNIGGDGPHDMLNDGIDMRQQKEIPAMSSTDHSKCLENHTPAHQKNLTNKTVSENGHANASHHSRSSSSSISSADASSSNVTYLTVSDISLRTQPLCVPPPSRPPPRSFDKQGYSKQRTLSSPIICLDGVSISKPVANDRVHQGAVKDNSPSFFGVEVDVSSAAAASAAAIKEAMELAQAKLKNAKELMEKKRDILWNSKKPDNHESVKRKQRKFNQFSVGQGSFEENLAASEKINEATGAAKPTQCCKEEEKVVLTKEDGQTRQRNDLNSYKLSKSADKSEKWETNKEYHELVNSEKYEMTDEVSEREGSMKETKLMTTIIEVKHNESIKDALVYEIESNRNLRKDNIALAHFVNDADNGSHVGEVGKPDETHKLRGQEVREPPSDTLSFAGSEKKMKPSDNSKIYYTHDNEGKSKLEASVEACESKNSFKFVDINRSKDSKEEKRKSEAAKCCGENFEKEISIANIAPELNKDEEKLNVANVVEEETEIQVRQRSCISKVDITEGACKCTDSEKTQIEEMQCNVQNVNQLERTMTMHEQAERKKLHREEQTYLLANNELRLKVDQETIGLEEDMSEWKSTVGATICKEQPELMKAAEVVCWQDCNGNKARDAQPELQQQQRDMNEDETPESCNMRNFEGHKVYEIELWDCGNEDTVEIQVQHGIMDKIMSVDPVIGKNLLNTTLHFHPKNLFEGGNLSIVSMLSHPITSQKIISDIKKAEAKEKERMEREMQQMENQERRLEEEIEKEWLEEENKEKTRLPEERKDMQRKMEEDMERARLLEDAKEKKRKMEEEKEQARLLEAKDRERKLKEEKEQLRLLEEAKDKERKLKEEKEQLRLLEEAKDKERKLKEEKEQLRLSEEAKDRERKLKEEKERLRLLEEAKDRERKLKEEKEQLRLLEEAKERERKLEEGKEQARLLEKTKGREKKVEEEQSKALEERSRKGRKLEEEKDRARLSTKYNEQKLEEERVKLLEKGKEREKKQEEKERARLLEEEKEREREREKDRAAVERATREAHERAFTEARERAERIAVERVTSEVRQRAVKEAQVKAEKTSSENYEKSLTEKAAREARLRAERAAVERATAEARERAVERALAEKTAADARERAERNNATYSDIMRKDTVTEMHPKAKDKDGPQDGQLRSAGSWSSNQANYDFADQCEGESVLRCKARLERHQRIAERAAKALAEKNTRDILAQREQAERDKLAEFLDADVKRWSNGKEGNLRALLSTLQYILGPESGWQPIPLTDVITATAVKKAYRKATLCVHPDKLQQRGASIQQKYICEKVFDLLKEAWNRFNSEESFKIPTVQLQEAFYVLLARSYPLFCTSRGRRLRSLEEPERLIYRRLLSRQPSFDLIDVATRRGAN